MPIMKQPPEAFPQNLPPLDEADRKIIDLLREDGRMSGRDMAQRSGLSEANVSRRMARLVEEGSVRILGMVPAALLGDARVVVCQHETNLALNRHVFRTARIAGCTTVLNPAPMRPDFDDRILDFTDVLVPNETEFVALVNRRGFTEKSLRALPFHELHRLCRSFDVPTIIVTLGARGCFVSQSRGHLFIPAHTGLKVVDTTGAGDAFVGGFAAGLVRFDGNIASAARYGNAAAGLSVTKFGTAPSMPAQRAIARLLRSDK